MGSCSFFHMELGSWSFQIIEQLHRAGAFILPLDWVWLTQFGFHAFPVHRFGCKVHYVVHAGLHRIAKYLLERRKFKFLHTCNGSCLVSFKMTLGRRLENWPLNPVLAGVDGCIPFARLPFLTSPNISKGPACIAIHVPSALLFPVCQHLSLFAATVHGVWNDLWQR